MKLLGENIHAVNIGADIFADALKAQEIETQQLNWTPPIKRTLSALQVQMMDRLADDVAQKIDEANAKVVSNLKNTDPYWVGMKPAIEVVPDMHEGLILHAGPEIPWDEMCDAQQQGGINGALFEGYAKTEEEAREKLRSGEIEFHSANDYHIVAPGSGIATPSLIVNIVEDRNTGSRGFCAPFEGPNRGGLGGWGIYNEDVREFLDLIRDTIAPTFTSLLEGCGGLALRRIFVRGVEMGDELHSRQDACGLIAVNEMMRMLFESNLPYEARKACVDLMYGTVRYFHPLGMASAMAVLESVRNVPYSTVVTAMEGNGVTYGIKLSGTGNRWYTAPSPYSDGGALVAANIDKNEILPWIGDSCMLEACGLGGFAAAASPAVMRAQQKTWQDGIDQSSSMSQIALDTHPYYLLPGLDYQGSPVGIDMRKVITTGVVPVIHGGIIAKNLRRLGSGGTKVPMDCFEKALEGFAEQYGKER